MDRKYTLSKHLKKSKGTERGYSGKLEEIRRVDSPTVVIQFKKWRKL
jgi:hypothetical protein